MHVDGDDYTYQAPPTVAPALRQFDLRPLPERFDTWCTALERRIENAERRIAHLELLIHRLLNAGEGES